MTDKVFTSDSKKKESQREPIFFTYRGEWYKGSVPNFYDNKDVGFSKILEDNYTDIKNEVLNFCNTNIDSFEIQDIPYVYRNENWSVYTFYGYLFKYPERFKLFPKLKSTLDQIPNLVSAQLSVLHPNTKVKGHFGGTNAMIRTHLGIVIPGSYPQIGFRLNREERCWEEGKVLSFCESHRHYVWNYSNSRRIVLLIDTIKPEYKDKKYYVIAGLIGILVMKMFANRFPVLFKASKNTERVAHKIIIAFLSPVLAIRDFFFKLK